MKMKIHVIMLGSGRREEFDAVSHEIKGFSGGTYHIFDMGNGMTDYYNDFGFQLIRVTKL